MPQLMFPEVTNTWNPVIYCPHACIYCSARELAAGRLKNLPQYRDYPKFYLVLKELRRKFTKGFIFVCNMSDLWAQGVPDAVIEDILQVVWNSPEASFLMLTKNPHRYLDFMHIMPPNVVLGATIETDRYPKSKISLAPAPMNRALNMWYLKYKHPEIKTMVCIEPIVDFDLWTLAPLVMMIKPEYVYIGYENHGHHLPEPPLQKTQKLIDMLQGFTVVKTKTLRESWDVKSG